MFPPSESFVGRFSASPMSQPPSPTAASSQFQAIFDAALKSYQKQTKKNILTHPLAFQLRTCNTTGAIISILQDQIREFDESCSSDSSFTKWLTPTVNVLCAFSASVSGGVSVVSFGRDILVLVKSPLIMFFRYFRLQARSLQVSVSSFWQVSIRVQQLIGSNSYV